MKKHFLLLSAALVAVLSCAKLEGPAPRQHTAQEECTLSLRFSTRQMDVCETKAAIDDDLDETIESLDLFFYDGNGEYLDHVRFTEDLDPDTWSYKKSFKYSSTVSVFALANFNEDCMNFLEELPENFIGGQNTCFPLDKNFKPHCIPMGGSGFFVLQENTESSIELWRYMWKLKIGTITADIDDDQVRDGNIWIKKVAITNYCNVLAIRTEEGGSVGYPDYIFGSAEIFSSGTAFGGVGRGFRAGYFTEDIGNAKIKPSQPIPSGNLLETAFNTYYNYNYEGGNIMKIDATGDLKEACSVSYPITGATGAMAVTEKGTRVMTVNQCFYGVCGGAFYQSMEVYKNETETAKLVIAVSIAGNMNYYIIPLCNMQPCMEYNIKNITLKGMGSAKCNSYPKIYPPVDLTAGYTIGEWDHTKIDNIDVGYSGYTGIYEN